MRKFSSYVLYFFVYSFAGWVHELCFFLWRHHVLRFGGILMAPLLPIYGFGAIILIGCFEKYRTHPAMVYGLSVLLTSAVEFTGSWVMDTLFHVTLWDYHDRFMNLQGRICLFNSLGFGLLAMFLIYVLHPWVKGIFDRWSDRTITTVAMVGLALFLVDFGNSARTLAWLRSDPVARESLEAVHRHIRRRIARIDALRVQLDDRRARRWERWSLQLHNVTLHRIHVGNPNIHFKPITVGR